MTRLRPMVKYDALVRTPKVPILKVGDLWVVPSELMTYQEVKLMTHQEVNDGAFPPVRLVTEFLVMPSEAVVMILDLDPVSKEVRETLKYQDPWTTERLPVSSWICQVLLEERPVLISVLSLLRKVSI